MENGADDEPPADLTLLLQSVGAGRASDADLFSLVHAKLRELAAWHLGRERTGHTLQPTALVNEAWLRLGGQASADWQSRAHFFGAAGEAMRRILVDHARSRNAEKRGARMERLPLDAVELVASGDPEHVLLIDEAVTRLEARDARLAKVVRLRFWAGLEEREVAELLQVTPRTVRRDWKLARAWLARELQR